MNWLQEKEKKKKKQCSIHLKMQSIRKLESFMRKLSDGQLTDGLLRMVSPVNAFPVYGHKSFCCSCTSGQQLHIVVYTIVAHSPTNQRLLWLILAFINLYRLQLLNTTLNNWSFGNWTVSFVSPRISMFFFTLSRETSRLSGNQTSGL